MDSRHLKKQWITTDEVLSKLREQGIDGIAGITVAYLESSGELGVIRPGKSQQHPSPKRRQGAG